jgi:hypothetical protein
MSMRGAWWLAALPLLTACGVEEGDYLVYRVNVSAFTSSDSCYPMMMVPVDQAEDSNSLRQGQTWVLYLAAADKLVLDAAGQALRGAESDDGYLFRGDEIDVTYVGDEQREAKVTAQIKTTINMFTDGSAVNGEVTRAETLKCDFLTATPSPGVCQAIPDCLREASFSGVELDDVELTEGVDRNPPLPPMP